MSQKSIDMEQSSDRKVTSELINTIDLSRRPDPFVDRDCVLLDGSCKCGFTIDENGRRFPICQKYDADLNRKVLERG